MTDEKYVRVDESQFELPEVVKNIVDRLNNYRDRFTGGDRSSLFGGYRFVPSSKR